MMRFFAFWKRVLGAGSSARAVGQIAMDAINKFFIPQLKRKLKDAEADGREKDADRLAEMIEDYARHADPRSAESKEFGDIVDRVVQRRVDPDTGEVLKMPSRTGRTLMDYLKGFEVMGGTDALEKFWSTIVISRAKYMMREMVRKNKDTFDKVYDTSDDSSEGGPGPGVMERIPDSGRMPFERMEEEETQAELMAAERRLRNYVKRHGDETHLAMFDRVFELVRKGKESISFKYDVYQPLIREMKLPFGEGRMHEKRKELEAYLIDGLRADRSDASKQLLRNVRIGSDAFVMAEFRCRLASWVLGEGRFC